MYSNTDEIVGSNSFFLITAKSCNNEKNEQLKIHVYEGVWLWSNTGI